MEILRLSPADWGLLAARAKDFGNSHRALVETLRRGGDDAAAERAVLLRRMEQHFRIDLGSLCLRWNTRESAAHPLERMIITSMVEERFGHGGRHEMWVLVDRVREIRELMGEEEPACDGTA